MKRFVDSLGIRAKLRELDLPEGGSNRAYDPVQIIESFWLSIWTGASRYIHADWLRYDTVLQAIFGFKRMPSQSTYSRFFNKFSDKRNTEVFPQLHAWLMQQVNIESITLDLGSTVITRSGTQQGSAKGYNPLRRRGRNSYHPLMGLLLKPVRWPMPGGTRATQLTVVIVWPSCRKPCIMPY